MGLLDAINIYCTGADSDLYLVSGRIDSGSGSTADMLIDAVAKRSPRAPSVSLILTTYGGDPHAAFRMGRCLQSHYSDIKVLVVGPCKSAGTLLALAAHEVVIAPTGELGPLDMQIAKPDELLSNSSGFDIFRALELVQTKAYSAFEEFLLKLTVGTSGNISTRTASEIAGGLSSGLFGPLMEQIDPIRLGEADRAITIAREYGERLGSHNLKVDGLEKLIAAYPSHSFVIDLEEAKGIFDRVRSMSQDEASLLDNLAFARYPGRSPQVFDLRALATPDDDENEEVADDDHESGRDHTRPSEEHSTTEPGEHGSAQEMAAEAPSSFLVGGNGNREGQAG